MQIKKVWLVAGIILALVGIPGVLEDLQSWEYLLSRLGTWQLWNYLLLLGGISVSVWSLLPVFYRQQRPLSRKKDRWTKLVEKLEPDQILELEKDRSQNHMGYFVCTLVSALILVGILSC